MAMTGDGNEIIFLFPKDHAVTQWREGSGSCWSSTGRSGVAWTMRGQGDGEDIVRGTGDRTEGE